MQSKFIGAAAAAAILASGFSVAMAQTPVQQTSPQMQQPSEPQAPSTPPSSAPATTPPSPAPDSNNSTQMQMKQGAAEAPTPVAHKQHALSACQRAILASEKALKKSQASPDTIAQAWQHIENAKQEKGTACKDEAKQAQEML